MGYYIHRAEEFYKRTLFAGIEEHYQHFLAHMPKKGVILDAGSGSGRDYFAFKTRGYEVVSFDASEEMCRLSSALTGQRTQQMRFQDMSFENKFDGIWASASLLHVPYDELDDVFSSLCRALKSAGILYGSFKYGEGERFSEDRQFYDMNENTLGSFLKMPFQITKWWLSEDRGKSANPSKKWLNFLATKTCTQN